MLSFIPVQLTFKNEQAVERAERSKSVCNSVHTDLSALSTAPSLQCDLINMCAKIPFFFIIKMQDKVRLTLFQDV